MVVNQPGKMGGYKIFPERSGDNLVYNWPEENPFYILPLPDQHVAPSEVLIGLDPFPVLFFSSPFPPYLSPYPLSLYLFPLSQAFGLTFIYILTIYYYLLLVYIFRARTEARR